MLRSRGGLAVERARLFWIRETVEREKAVEAGARRGAASEAKGNRGKRYDASNRHVSSFTT